MKNQQKQFKALVIDADGTLIPNRRDGMPSPRVKAAITKAKNSVHIGIASGRPLFLLEHIFEDLSLSGPSILRGGAQLYDTSQKRVIAEQQMRYEDISAVLALSERFQIGLKVDVEDKSRSLLRETIPPVCLGIFTNPIPYTKAKELWKQFARIPTVSAHIVPDWTVGKYSVIISDALATKQHGILSVAQNLKISPKDIIGIGDGGNDFPLLMACGLKVAMGNALPALKEIADYIAPSVEEDGVADVIEKFILSKGASS